MYNVSEDIVGRLRNGAVWDIGLQHEAAAEIERLRTQYKEQAKLEAGLIAEIERLRQEVKVLTRAYLTNLPLRLRSLMNDPQAHA